MRISVSADEHNPLVDFVIADAEERGHEVTYFGPRANEDSQDWPETTRTAARSVANGDAEEAIVMCWTGTGASIAANKVPGVRAALCHDGATARGARVWNHANTLALSMRMTSLPIAKEILDQWFATPFSADDWNQKQIERIRTMDNER